MINTSSALYRWYVVILLLLIFILSYFDRYILSLLVEPIKASMGLSDFQIGLLLGPAFSIFHVLVGIPLGLLADKTGRRWLLMAGIFIWCTMTVMSGFAMSFLPLLIFRLGLGLGEAVVSPCSVSIISDYFNRKDRPRAISLYMAGPYLGAGLAFLLGGVMIAQLDAIGPQTFLSMGPFVSWQMAFFIAGIPGFMFVLLMLTVKEPPRTDQVVAKAGVAADSAIKYMLARWRGFGTIILGSTCNFAMSTLTLWNVPLFQRIYGWDILTIGAVTGVFYFTAGPIGTALALWSSKHLGKNTEDSAMRTLILGLCITIPACALYPMMPTAEWSVVFMFIAFIGKSTATAGGPAALQNITPGEMRSRSVAIFNTLIALVGPLMGPPIIGLVTDMLGYPEAISYALSGFAVIVGVPSLILVCLGLKHYRALVYDMNATLAAQEAQATAVETDGALPAAG